MEYHCRDLNQKFFNVGTKTKIWNMCRDQKLVLTKKKKIDTFVYTCLVYFLLAQCFFVAVAFVCFLCCLYDFTYTLHLHLLSLIENVCFFKGSFGEILKAHWRGTPVAVKRILPSLSDDRLVM